MFQKPPVETAKWIIAGIFSMGITLVLFCFLGRLSVASQPPAEDRRKMAAVSISDERKDPEPVPLQDSEAMIEPGAMEIRSTRTRNFQQTQQFELLSAEDFSMPADAISMPDIRVSSISPGDFKIPEVFTAGDLDAPLTALVRMQPAYPFNARKRRVEGFVTVRFVVTTEGRVEQVSVVEAEPPGVFDRCVIQCVSGWKFKPGTVAGVTVDAWAETTIAFELKKG